MNYEDFFSTTETHSMSGQDEFERVVWETYPSWRHFSWLYFLSLWTASRGFIFLYAEVYGWILWMVGAGLLVGVAAGLRYWAKYFISTKQVLIRNGYSGKTIRCARLDMIHSIEIMQGPLAKFLGIGTLVIRSQDSNRTLRFRGIKNPAIVGTKLRALLPASSPIFTQTL